MHLIYMTLVFIGISAHAEIFSSKIKYWGDPMAPSETVIEKPSGDQKKDEQKKPSFDWDKYLNPENDEFFCENKNNCPPAPFMEVYRRPNKENVLLWNKYVQKRNQVHKRGTLAIQSLLGNGLVQPAQVQVMNQEAALQPKTEISPETTTFLFYFDANCPNCKAMYKTVNELMNRGYYVEAVRLDHTNTTVEGLGLAWSPANPEELKKLQISATPLLAILDSRSKKVLKVTGYQTVDSIFQTIQQGM